MPATSTQTKYLHLARKPGSYYKQLFIKDGWISTWLLHAWHVADGMTVEELAADFNLPVEAVREAIEYCASNPPEMADDKRREEALMEASGMNEPGYKYNPRPKLLPPEEMARILSQ